MKRISSYLLSLCIAPTLVIPAIAERDDDDVRKHRKDDNPSGYKNIIFMVPDGCSQSIQTLARWYKGEDLTLDSMNAGMVRIDMANSVITGSAAAATAFACGEKTTVRFLGVGPRTDDLLSTFPEVDPENAYAPMASILELAKAKGKSTGLVATSRITHATPAAFASHIPDRGWDNEIMEHMVYNNLTVALGGGRRHLLPTALGGKRTDGENLEQVLIDRGYTIVTTKSEMDTAEGCSKLWGGFAMSHMDADIDRAPYHPEEPSIAEMTAKALEVLSRNKRGFFLMVEGSQVDWAGHNNDPIYMTTDFLAFDEAVKVAKDFADEDGDTLVLAFPDHNTGGMKIGHYNTSMPYTASTVEDLVAPLKGMKVTAGSVISEMDGDYSEANMIVKIKQFWGIDATPADIVEITDLAGEVGWSYALARVISRNHTLIGWTTHGHNGEDVPVWIYPYADAIGRIDNTEVPSVLVNWKSRSGPNGLDELTENLYNDVDDVFPGEWTVDFSDPANPVLGIRGEARLPLSKDLLIIDGKEYPLGSLVVYAPLRDFNLNVVEDRFFIPERAIKLINTKQHRHR